jgi:hypothetical protein
LVRRITGFCPTRVLIGAGRKLVELAFEPC